MKKPASRSLRFLAAGLAAAFVFAGAGAQEVPDPGQNAAGAAPQGRSVMQLLAAGFEVRAVTPLDLAAARRINAAIETEALLVTLQRGPALAVCFVSLPGWTFLSEAAVEATQNCDLRGMPGP